MIELFRQLFSCAGVEQQEAHHRKNHIRKEHEIVEDLVDLVKRDVVDYKPEQERDRKPMPLRVSEFLLRSF